MTTRFSLDVHILISDMTNYKQFSDNNCMIEIISVTAECEIGQFFMNVVKSKRGKAEWILQGKPSCFWERFFFITAIL